MAEHGERATGGVENLNVDPESTGSHRATPLKTTTLADLGINKSQSSRWQGLADLPEDEFEATVELSKRQAVASVEQTAAERTAEKKAARAVREAELGAKQCGLPDRKYGVIYCDPEWKFEVRSPNGMDRAAENHYPTSSLTDIKLRNVLSIAADDAVLFMWATVPMLPQALEVMQTWGFEYKSNFVWVKDKAGRLCHGQPLPRSTSGAYAPR